MFLRRSGTGALIRSPNGALNRMSSSVRPNVWGWRWRHIVHTYWDLAGPVWNSRSGNHSSISFYRPPVTFSPYGTVDTFPDSAIESYLSLILSMRIAIVNLCFYYLKPDWELQEVVTNYAQMVDEAYVGQHLLNSGDSFPIEVLLNRISSELGINIGGMSSQGHREWSNCLSDNTLVYQLTPIGVVRQSSELSNGEIVFDELEIVLRYIAARETWVRGFSANFGSWSVPISRSVSSSTWGGYYPTTSDDAWFSAVDKTVIETYATTSATRIQLESSMNRFWFGGTEGSPYTWKYYATIWWKEFFTVPSEGYSPWHWGCYQAWGVNDTYQADYERQRVIKFYSYGFERELSNNEQAEWENASLPITLGAWTVLDTTPKQATYTWQKEVPFEYMSRPVDMIGNSPTDPGGNITRSTRYTQAHVCMVTKVDYLAASWLGYAYYTGRTCWYCSVTTKIVPYDPSGYANTAYYSHQRPYGFSDWITYLTNNPWTFRNLNNCIGAVTIVSYTAGNGSLAIGTHSIGIGQQIEMVTIPSAIPTVDSLPTVSFTYLQISIQTSNTFYSPLSSILYSRCQVLATTITYNQETFYKTTTSPAAPDTLEIRSYTNFGRIKYTISNIVGTHFSLDKSNDDVAYTGENIKSDLIISYSPGLAAGVYYGSFRINYTGGPAYKTITIATTIV